MAQSEKIATISRTLALISTLIAANPAFTALADATVYRCDGPNGAQFSDRPCGPNQETVTIRDTRVGGSVGDNLPAFDDYLKASPAAEAQEPEEKPEDACRFISSTDLRTYIAREQIVEGMTRDQVEKAFGKTSEKYASPQETWVYQSKYYGALYELTYIYFRNGCVERVEYRKP